MTNSIDDRKGIYAKEIVSSIISAARRKRQSSLDSPDMSDQKENDAESNPADKSVASELEVIVTTNMIGGSAHSLIELGSTGDAPALPVEASAFRMQDETIPERKRSASLGGESALPPCISNHVSSELGSISEFVDGSQSPAEACGCRSRTSSGSFVSSKSTQAQPIDAAGIRSYCGLSAVTQERIRRFEQVKLNDYFILFWIVFYFKILLIQPKETKALLQRDLARQWRDTDVRRLDKSEVESAWQRAKLEMETEDFLDALADNPSGKAECFVFFSFPSSFMCLIR